MKKKVVPYLLLAPMILIMGALVFYPVAATFSYSLKKWKLTQPGDIRVIGFKNYVDILTSDSFWYSLQNTLVILAVVVALTTVVGFLVSSFLNIQVRLSGVLLALAVLPWALPPFVNGILWKFVFYSGYGFLNKLLVGLGLFDQPVEFLTSRWSLLLVVSVVVVWRSVPFMALVCLAGRQSIPVDFYEAARIDGGGSFQIFRRITLPSDAAICGGGSNFRLCDGHQCI
ncbi:sugar ABC transporter permease [Massilistercora timonensis]|uniref:carbohydrate ABC transporter permease n=1 Tax=Massilistercora timonensis TaxID=2086584 RepID=UPI00320A9700